MGGSVGVIAPRIGQLALRVRLALLRFGAIPSAACLLGLAGLSAWLWGVPHLQTQGQTELRTLARAQQTWRTSDGAAPIVPPSVLQQRVNGFYDALGETRYAEQQIKTLFAIAGKTGLSLSLADYKFAGDRNGRYQTYQIVLPVKGSYSAIRQFCEQTLLAIPFASLDEMNFKRDAIVNRTLEAKLHFTLYLADMHPAGGAKESPRASGANL
jgi:hypothetical protein